MATKNQELGLFGEQLVAKSCACPKCKRNKSLRLLPPNFKCADIICDFCGYLAQVKSSQVKDPALLPKQVLGAAWGPQKERMDSAIYFPLFLVLVAEKRTNFAIYYLSADLQTESIFKARKPLSAIAKRAGWQGFYYDLKEIGNRMVRVV